MTVVYDTEPQEVLYSNRLLRIVWNAVVPPTGSTAVSVVVTPSGSVALAEALTVVGNPERVAVTLSAIPALSREPGPTISVPSSLHRLPG